MPKRDLIRGVTISSVGIDVMDRGCWRRLPNGRLGGLKRKLEETKRGNTEGYGR
jgi:hypothetical protein